MSSKAKGAKDNTTTGRFEPFNVHLTKHADVATVFGFQGSIPFALGSPQAYIYAVRKILSVQDDEGVDYVRVWYNLDDSVSHEESCSIDALHLAHYITGTALKNANTAIDILASAPHK
ncbi:hypothetical protein GMORB2_3207 [Geosmithia morbida]|uniref:Uncharacterized protein n=1 Tax=Geosmithia morbida TaxID=1094350 RepID=A0A9P5D1F5_9HYPO|nr:uncharacterized protein GMORB2_3207 [Geosmithia morbida]KAF4120406.1 hypothetical protein GMORB2_3207 [Geosmithia morbida]